LKFFPKISRLVSTWGFKPAFLLTLEDDSVTAQEVKRKLAAILSADVKGYSRLMGSLFHMVVREEGLELRLLKEMAYDVITLGNHEFA
jgi:class 3 adenylate cyclase